MSITTLYFVVFILLRAAIFFFLRLHCVLPDWIIA